VGIRLEGCGNGERRFAIGCVFRFTSTGGKKPYPGRTYTDAKEGVVHMIEKGNDRKSILDQLDPYEAHEILMRLTGEDEGIAKRAEEIALEIMRNIDMDDVAESFFGTSTISMSRMSGTTRVQRGMDMWTRQSWCGRCSRKRWNRT